MAEAMDWRRSLLGADPTARWRWVGVAVGQFLVTGVFAFVADTADLPVLSSAEPVLLLFVGLGTVLAAVAAARHGGLLVSWLLVVAPVGGPLTYYEAVAAGASATPVAMPLSFQGHGAATFWLPAALLLGSLAFSAGVAIGRTLR